VLGLPLLRLGCPCCCLHRPSHCPLSHHLVLTILALSSSPSTCLASSLFSSHRCLVLVLIILSSSATHHHHCPHPCLIGVLSFAPCHPCSFLLFLLSCHPPTAPASKKTHDCRFLQVQELFLMTQCVVIIGAGIEIHPMSSCSQWCYCQMIHHPASSGSQAWVSSPEWASQSRHPLSSLSLLPPAHPVSRGSQRCGGGITSTPPVVVGPPANHPMSSCS
jgi:hypothetical protein